MRRRTMRQRLAETGNVRGELCRLDRELKKRPPTADEHAFLEEVVMDEWGCDLETCGHAERVQIDAEIEWNLTENDG